MGFFSSKQYDALNEAGKVWTKTVGKHNVDEKIKECIVADDALRAAWIVKKFKNDSFSFKTNFVDQCLNFKSFNCLQFYIDTVAFNLTPSVDGDKELVLRMFLTAAHKKDNGLWQYLETKNGNTGFPDKTKIINQVFKAAWLEKASEYLIIEDTLDHALYLDALKLWPKDEHETFSELLAFAQKLSPAYLHEVLDSALYDAVSKGYKTRAETLIDAGANVNLVYDKRPVACILRAAMNEDPQMIDLLIESGAKMDEVGPYLMEEVRAQKPFSPIIGHLKKIYKSGRAGRSRYAVSGGLFPGRSGDPDASPGPAGDGYHPDDHVQFRQASADNCHPGR
jgi:hypothetical protein